MPWQTTFGSGGFVKSPGGTGTLTASTTVNAASEISGTLPVANGGTGLSSPTAGAVLLGNGTGAFAAITGGASGNVLTWNGSTWAPASPSAGGVTSVSAGTGISVSGSTGAVSIGNTGVTSISAGSGITVSGSTGSITISASGSSGGVTSFNSRTGAITPQSYDYSSYYGQLGGANSWSSTNTFLGQVNISGGIQSQAYNFAASTSFFLSGAAVQLAINGTYNFYFYSNGNATAVNGSWISGSDIRVKENIATSTDGLQKVMQLRPIKFSFKQDKAQVANRYGFVAQEIEQVLPDVVYTDENEAAGIADFKSVGYSEIVPVLVKAIQELKAEVDALKAAK